MYILLFLFWIILNGKITWEIVTFGIVLTGALACLLYVLFQYTPKKDFRFLRKAPVFFVYIFVLLWEILKSCVKVMYFIIKDRRNLLTPSLVTFHAGLHTGFGRFVLANSITLTPGTITVQVDGDEFTVHCLTRELLDTTDANVFIRMIRRMEA